MTSRLIDIGYFGFLDRHRQSGFVRANRIFVRRVHYLSVPHPAGAERTCMQGLWQGRRSKLSLLWSLSRGRGRISFLVVGPQEPLVATVKRRKLAWLGHVTRYESSQKKTQKTNLQGTLEDGFASLPHPHTHPRGGQSKWWMDNLKEWTSLPILELLTMISCRKDWERISAESRPPTPTPKRPKRSKD